MKTARILAALIGILAFSATTASAVIPTLTAQYTACSITGAMSPPNYGLRLDGFYDNNSNSEVTFGFNHVLFDVFSDGSARLYGEIEVAELNGSAAGAVGSKYDMDVHFVAANTGIISGYNAAWDYYVIDPDAGTELIRQGDATDYANLWTFPLDFSMPFQVGNGANGKNANFGAAGWLNWVHNYQGAVYGSETNHYYSSDFLMDLKPVPEPGTIALLGLGLLGGARRLRRNRKS